MEKTVLIVTDGAEDTQKMARAIEKALEGCRVALVRAENFEGPQLLSADVCFLGAGVPNPPSFAYLYTVLEHINLAGRPCGIFSNSEEAAAYLRGMVRDSELALDPQPFLGTGDIGDWAARIITRSVEKNTP
ncbi:MAG: hypothetical protein LBP60_02110 [Spirochaetaceae bacterium]|nr:hypothetical protein [Spirochaetaceae bacterium]